ncbi:unnamed protein product [Pedinophyceae sp. YPF-701]|nr:unnamed protein product [Pedinophyceae sp. YPF-701]
MQAVSLSRPACGCSIQAKLPARAARGAAVRPAVRPGARMNALRANDGNDRAERVESGPGRHWRSAALPAEDSAPEGAGAVSRVVAKLAEMPRAALIGVCVFFLSLCGTVGAAEAARSGGRAGGSAFAARRTSYTSGSSLAKSSSSSLSSSPSSYGPRTTTHRHTHVHVGPSFGLSSFFFPGFGFGMGYGFNPFGPLFQILTIMFLAYTAYQFFGNNALGDGGDDGYFGSEKISTMKLQVGLMATAADIKRDIEKQAKRTDTSDPESLHFFLQEVVLSLMRNQAKCVYGHSEGKVVTGLDKGEEAFNNMSLMERSKFEEETFVNYSGRSKTRTFAGGKRDDPNELIMVTILLAVEGSVKPPKVKDRTTLQQTLTQLGGLSTSQVVACEVLWTPQADGDTYSRDDLITDYPYMQTL